MKNKGFNSEKKSILCIFFFIVNIKFIYINKYECMYIRKEKGRETEDREGNPKRNRLILFLFKNSALKKKAEN